MLELVDGNGTGCGVTGGAGGDSPGEDEAAGPEREPCVRDMELRGEDGEERAADDGEGGGDLDPSGHVAVLEHVGGSRPDGGSSQFDCEVCTAETESPDVDGCVWGMAGGCGGRGATEEGLGESGGHLEPPGAVAVLDQLDGERERAAGAEGGD
mmetsp:Transcript_62086/g.93734  ORF Transcript_62086/g.93734 Transcript_62086/m.93734 type:complete len:154 (+) Transcript_62086:401-862(+)